MEGNGNHLYTMDKILAFIIFSQNDRWHIHYHFSSYFAEKERTLSNLTNSDFSPRMLTTLRRYRFLGKVWWLLVTVMSEGNDMKATTKQDLSHSHTAIQSEPVPDMMLSSRHINYIIVRRGGGTSLQNLGSNSYHCKAFLLTYDLWFNWLHHSTCTEYFEPLSKTFDLNMSQLFSLLSTGIGNEGRFAMSPKFEIRRQKTEPRGRVSFADSLYW